MLIEFNVTNYRSVSNTQALNMTANKMKGLENNLFDPGVRGVSDLVTSAAIYGPNAAGKSNLIKAIYFMRNFVLNSSKEKQEGDLIDVEPFAFDEEKRNTPSDFEVIFIKEGVKYQYGFSATRQKVIHEWLLAYPEGRPQRWFERSHGSIDSQEQWYFGPKFSGDRNVWKKATRSNALFLSTAIQLNSDQLKPVFGWFQELQVIPGRISPGFTIDLYEDKDKKQRIIDFMNAAGFSISDIQLKKENFSIEKLPSEMPQDLKEKILEDLGHKEILHIKFMHPSTCGSELIPIDLEDESEGTRKFFSLVGPWMDILEHGIILLIDELDNSMHPLMVRFLVGLLHNRSLNKNKAQLIFTTHDTSILDKDFLRRDQVWFVEKDQYNATHLYPLTDFSPRKGEALEKGYLQGKYGALPFIGELEL